MEEFLVRLKRWAYLTEGIEDYFILVFPRKSRELDSEEHGFCRVLPNTCKLLHISHIRAHPHWLHRCRAGAGANTRLKIVSSLNYDRIVLRILYADVSFQEEISICSRHISLT
jgi:hypothetical protein